MSLSVGVSVWIDAFTMLMHDAKDARKEINMSKQAGTPYAEDPVDAQVPWPRDGGWRAVGELAGQESVRAVGVLGRLLPQARDA